MKKYFLIPSVISALVLWVFGWDDEYVSIIRLFAFAAAFWCAFGDPKNVVSKRTSMKIAIPMLIVMLVYNPVFPTEIDYFDFYAGINIITGIALVWCAIQRAKLFALPKVNTDPAIQKIKNQNPELLDQIKAMGEMTEDLIKNTVDEDARKICEILGLESANDEIKEYTKHVKRVCAITQDKSFDRMTASIQANAPVDLTDEDCKKIYEVLTGTKTEESLCQGGDGSKESPVIINATKSRAGVAAEYAWISQRHGIYDKDWKRKISISYNKEDGTPCDLITAETTDGSEFTYHFDISRFYGKW